MGSGEGRPKRQGSLWHESFYQCISDRAPPGFEVRSEIPLSLRPRRADLLLLRRQDAVRGAVRSAGHSTAHNDDQARILRGLWPRLPAATLVEFKSPTRELRRSELLRLFGYGVQYHERTWRTLPHRSDLALALVVPSLNQALADELGAVDCQLRPLGRGYAQLIGFLYTTYVVCTDQVSEAEQDDFLRIFSHHAVQTREAYHWLEHWIVGKQTMPNVKEREGYDEMLEKLIRSLPPERILRLYKPEERLAGIAPAERLAGLDPAERLAGLDPAERLAGLDPAERLAGLDPAERLAGLDPAERLAGLDPAERLAGLSREQQILALPDEVLRALSDEYIRSLPGDVQQVIRRRLAQGK